MTPDELIPAFFWFGVVLAAEMGVAQLIADLFWGRRH